MLEGTSCHVVQLSKSLIEGSTKFIRPESVRENNSSERTKVVLKCYLHDAFVAKLVNVGGI